LARADVTHSTNLAGPRLFRSPLVVTVHDLSFCREPGWHKADNVEFSLGAVEKAVKNATLLIAPSHFTAAELEDLYPQSRGRVRVVPEAVLPAYRPASDKAQVDEIKQRYGLERPYLLCVGTLEPRKNLVRLIKAFHQLLADGQKDFDLVLAGGSGWKTAEIEEAINDPAGKGQVRRLGYVPGPRLPALYQGAYALAYPSLYEGFGLPVLESLSCGVPVITSLVASMPEVAGEAAIYVDPYDQEDINRALAEITGDAGLRKRLAAKALEQAACFTQVEVGRAALKVYREAAGR
jgi:glycosyltransferase involved in cell wall biosynthesis